jgi:hypothetical protein
MKSPATQRFAARKDAAVLESMVDGGLGDEMDLNVIPSRKVFLDIEMAR